MSLVINLAASASVLAIINVGTPKTSAANLAEFNVLSKVAVGTKTFPPKWPHFFSEAN